MADMIKFFKGLEASLPTTGVNGALYITTDEGAIYLGTGTGMKRLGDFVQVDNVAALPEKAHESCLYYCVAENILAKWNGTEWKQINKQPTAEEMKTLLGLGSMAYKSEVVEGDLNADLAAKINAASSAQHTHDNKTVLDGITAEKVAVWDSAEADAIAHADGLNTAMNTRVEALEAIDHEHANKALLDTYTQTETDLADAVAKKHAHTFVESELNKIADGDVAKWNAVVANHLTSDDKTALENAIKEAKKAGTDANTNIETYKVANDARVLAVEEDIAEITGENGILVQAKSYSDGKLATARTEISAEIDTDVKVVADELAGYKTSNDAALAGVKAIAEAAATKEYTDAELAKKVAKTDYEADKATFATKTELGGVDAKFANYKTAADQKLIDDAQDVEIGKKVDKIEGYSLVSDTEIARLAEVDNYDDTALAGRVTTAEGKITALETESAKHALKTEVEAVDAKFADYVTSEAYGVDKEATEAALADRYTKSEADEKFAIKGADAYDDTALSNRVKAIEDDYLVEADKTELSGLVTAEKERAEGIEGGLRTDVDVIKGDYLKATDKTELEGKITAEETRAKGVEESLQTQINTIMNNPDAEGAINSINEFTQYVADHGTIAEGFRADIDKNKEDIAAINNESTGILKQAKDYADGLAGNYAEAEHDHVVADITDFESAVATKVESYGYATTGYADGKASDAQAAAEATAASALATARTEITAEIDADVKALADGQVKTNTEAIATKANSADVYAKTETYNKTEIEALFTWGEF